MELRNRDVIFYQLYDRWYLGYVTIWEPPPQVEFYLGHGVWCPHTLFSVPNAVVFIASLQDASRSEVQGFIILLRRMFSDDILKGGGGQMYKGLKHGDIISYQPFSSTFSNPNLSAGYHIGFYCTAHRDTGGLKEDRAWVIVRRGVGGRQAELESLYICGDIYRIANFPRATMGELEAFARAMCKIFGIGMVGPVGEFVVKVD